MQLLSHPGWSEMPWSFAHSVPLRSNTGYEIFQGNNEVECVREPHASTSLCYKREFERYATLGEIRYCKEAFGRAAEYMRQHPRQTIRRTVARIYVSWLTDLTDHWNPDPEHNWWTRSWRSVARFLASALLTLASAGIVLWGALTGRLLPYSPLFAAILLVLPFPLYFTLADPEYTGTLRMWLAVTAACLLALRSPASLSHRRFRNKLGRPLMSRFETWKARTSNCNPC